ncbi:MAG: MarR-family transcriptional regulator [Amycolatopsis sp.]|jgi:DNA-binding MarR family transcriptional regulator|uniref:MarR family winged helix-turn-helix transcriptional regulator n=1 Tax=Amycolatopsis sp. TaxID=37632 RepID=UPI00262531C0|nr:MarR family winged helix-turn-helix transcriptional regulator [Amycolatopsis sp.]MCU1683826.1 MarR-family transcriptional regulator [Amycolatopsis sp.]
MGGHSEAGRIGLRYLTSAYRVRKGVDEGMVASGLSLARAKVLEVLERRGPLRQGELADELGLAARSVTQAVEGLARDGFLDRLPDSADGRVKVVRLTTRGSAALTAAWAAGQHAFEEIFGALGPQRLAELDELLGAVETAVASQVRRRS